MWREKKGAKSLSRENIRKVNLDFLSKKKSFLFLNELLTFQERLSKFISGRFHKIK